MSDEKPRDVIKLDLGNMDQEQNKSSFNLKKYLNFFSRKKYLIFTIWGLITLVWIVLYSLFHENFASYTTSVVIRFDDPRMNTKIGAVTDFSAGVETGSKVAVLSTNNFLGRVVDSLNLHLIVKTSGIKRTDLLQDIKFSDNAKTGNLRFLHEDSVFSVFFSDATSDIREELVYQQSVSPTQPLQFQVNGISLKLNPLTFRKKNEIVLVNTSRRLAINSLRENISTLLDRTRTILTIEYTDKDPDFSAKVTNTLANLFILQLWDYERYQTLSILKC